MTEFVTPRRKTAGRHVSKDVFSVPILAFCHICYQYTRKLFLLFVRNRKSFLNKVCFAFLSSWHGQLIDLAKFSSHCECAFCNFSGRHGGHRNEDIAGCKVCVFQVASNKDTQHAEVGSVSSRYKVVNWAIGRERKPAGTDLLDICKAKGLSSDPT